MIFASHSDQTLSMLTDATEDESQILSAIKYQKNRMILHSDESFMPKNKKAWSSWVYLSQNKKDEGDTIALSYWRNNLQNLKTETINDCNTESIKRPFIVIKT